jgi:3',5'-cyclic AMP phosphodiesterase CpdA
MAFRFLHTSDIHFLDLEGVPPWRFIGKRITGGLNLWLHRGRMHDVALFDRMAELLPELDVDRVVVTGDLTNLSLEPEFELSRRKLEALPVACTVIPGNHDTYTRGSARDELFERYLGHLMDGERLDGERYPFMERYPMVGPTGPEGIVGPTGPEGMVGPQRGVALIGVSTAVPTPPFDATGRCGPGQLDRLGRLLDAAAGEKLARVVLIHHPPVAGVSKPHKKLVDLEAFGRVIAEHGAELVLHGHEHVRIETRLPGPHGDVPVHGAASATSLSATPRREASFSIYEVSPTGVSRDLYTWNGNEYALCHA